VKYFTGTGTYRRTFALPEGWRARAPRVELDLGRLWAIGEVRVNGTPLGVVWTYPFRVDCTAALRDGPNVLEVDVIGTWHNRLVGEARGAVPKWTKTHVTARSAASAARCSPAPGPNSIPSTPASSARCG
jgi:hypothetical protein